MIDLHRHSAEYHRDGYTVVRWVPPGNALQWAAIALSHRDEAHVVERKATGEHKAGDEGGVYRHRILDGHHVRVWLPELYGAYLTLPLVAGTIVGREVILSPYSLSAVNVKLYDEAGSEQGWHCDTNAVTALAYLTDDGHPTLLEDLEGVQHPVAPGAGGLLLMQGRRLRHCVPALPQKMLRVTVPLNLYFPDDVDRPAGIDEVVYGAMA